MTVYGTKTCPPDQIRAVVVGFAGARSDLEIKGLAIICFVYFFIFDVESFQESECVLYKNKRLHVKRNSF